MKPLKLSKRKLLLAVILIVIITSLFFIFYPKKPTQDNFIPLTVNADFIKKQEESAIQYETPLPLSIKIPSIKVDAIIEYVGVTPEGAMGAPAGPNNVGWFFLGPRPGDKGNAVVDGHSGWKNNTPAVFDNLDKLKKGDVINIENVEGGITTFIVRESREYDPKADASSVFTSNDDKAHLNLITCSGFWNKILKSHSQRLVVFADKEIIN